MIPKSPVVTIRTPLLPIHLDVGTIFAKLEYLQPTGSIKSRIGPVLVANAISHHSRIDSVTDGTSGRSGAAIARAAAAAGLSAFLFLPEALGHRSRLIEQEGGEVILVAGGMKEAREAAAAFALSRKTTAYLNQFGTALNVQTHAETTATEIASALPSGVKHVRVVAGSGTGGTIVGIGQGLRGAGYSVELWVATPIDPLGAFSSRVPGVADHASLFVDWSTVNVVQVLEHHALSTARMLISKGILAGPSSGLSLAAARQLLLDRSNLPHEAVVSVFPDHARDYRESHPELFLTA